MENITHRVKKSGYHSNLEEAVAMRQQNWPTPTGSDYKGSGPTIIRKDGRSRMDRLDYVTEQQGEARGSLHPDWVEWLMGLPIGWSKLEALPPTAYDQWFDQNNSWWDEERGLPRVGVGIKNRIKRLKALGNGLVPACVPEFLRQITS